MPTYRYLDPPAHRECRQCFTAKPTATDFDWRRGWPGPVCKECRRESHRQRYADRAFEQAHRDILNAQRRARYARAKEREAATAARAAMSPTERLRAEADDKRREVARSVSERIREARLSYGRWREREIRAGRMQRPANVNPYTGDPRPTKEEREARKAQRQEDLPRPKPPRWAEMTAAYERWRAERLREKRTAVLERHRPK